MSSKTPPPTREPRSTLASYLVGYILSVALTVTAYIMVTQHTATKWVLISWVAGLAVVQFVIQLLFFLHLDQESKPRWKLLVFSFMILVGVIIVGGSLWIMDNLNYRMTPQQMDSYMQDQDSL